MTSDALTNPTVHIAYAQLTIQLALARGVRRELLLEGLDIDPAELQRPGGRLTLRQWGRLIARALKLTRHPGIAYEFGLRNNLTTHGIFGYGLLSSATVRDAFEFSTRFAPLTTVAFGMRWFIEGDQAVLRLTERIPFGSVRQASIEMCLVSWWHTLMQSFEALQPQFEMRFEWPEPPHFRAFRDRLPPLRFAAGVNELRCPVALLDRRIGTANEMTARMVAGQCERELAQMAGSGNCLERVRAALVAEHGEYPGLEAVACRLCTSTRTLKRRLHALGYSFQQLLDEVRHREAMRLLANPALSVEDIAGMVGYSSSANFTRAFRKWQGATPGAFRHQPASPPPLSAPAEARAALQ
ncbi:MAG TPA: AraC family transcriptional regulator ligand-binding domain-containing protein [Solimonas sp.]|nr:AraC family transcriptional regulator ligand-binding domain-containing protein [Solimonas sp.]